MLKFTREGKFIKQIGKKGVKADSNSTEHFFQVAKIFVDEKGNEAYISDGYGNKRVAVLDRETGAFKRYWGAYGNKPSDENLGRYNPTAPPAQQFRNPVHCAELSNDNIVYVCDRVNNRIQTFTKEGKFLKEVLIEKESLADGSVWDIVFSKDPQQKFIYRGRRPQPEDPHPRPRVARGADLVRRRRPSAGSVVRPAQHRDRQRRATSTRPKPTRASASRSSSTRAWRR